jgi:hypothetical protein
MTAPNLCPALLLDSPEERVICFLAPHIPGAWGLVCRRCWAAMLKGEADREAVRQEWEEDT